MEKQKKWMRWGMAVVWAAFLVCGCSVKEALLPGSGEQKEYGRAESMILVSTERLRYEELYSEQIWTAAVDNRGTTFETVLLAQIRDFLKELRLMSLMAEEEGIILSGREKEFVRLAASTYMEALGESGKEALSVDQETVEALFSDYWEAEKLVERLTEGANLEVSDSEAKVITVWELECSDFTTANTALSRIEAGELDFSAAVKEYSEEEEMERQIHRGLCGEEYEKAAYSLLEGQVSGVIFDGGKYYLLKCVNDYDEPATRLRKEQMVRQRKNEAFYSSYEEYQKNIVLTGDDGFWRELSITKSPSVRADFFAIYEEICLGTDG